MTVTISGTCPLPFLIAGQVLLQVLSKQGRRER